MTLGNISQKVAIDKKTGSNVNCLVDRFGRPTKGVRISVNPSKHCNFECFFCHKEGIQDDPSKTMTSLEIKRIVQILSKFGVNFVKLTGGEPMLRSDILDVVRNLGELQLKEISMTTNGTKLSQLAAQLKNYGLDRVNISLHSLKESRFQIITGTKRLTETMQAIKSCVEAELTPVKLNVVVMKGMNDDEVDDIIEYVSSLGGGDSAILQFIELVLEGEANREFYNKYHVNLDSIEKKMRSLSTKEKVREMHFRHKYLLSNGVWVELVKPMHNSEFCMGNNRIRITYDGQFKPCLLRNDNHIDFLSQSRKGASDEELAELFKLAVQIREPFFKPAIPATQRNKLD